MSLLKKEPTVINITSDALSVLNMYLKVFLAKEHLTPTQLTITAVLVSKYAIYIADGVKEPYASKLLFSTETRKEVYTELNMSASQLTNNFSPLVKKGVLACDEGSYFMNPQLLPSSVLTFNFAVKDAKPRQSN